MAKTKLNVILVILLGTLFVFLAIVYIVSERPKVYKMSDVVSVTSNGNGGKFEFSAAAGVPASSLARGQVTERRIPLVPTAPLIKKRIPPLQASPPAASRGGK